MGEDGRPLPHDGQQFGDLLVRGPHTLSRYFRSDAKAADAEGWFDTGDVASIDAEGYMKVRGGSRWRGMQPRHLRVRRAVWARTALPVRTSPPLDA